MQHVVRRTCAAWIIATALGLVAASASAVAELEGAGRPPAGARAPAGGFVAPAADAAAAGFVAPDAGVTRGAFTRAVVDREPVESLRVLERLADEPVEIRYFTELRGLAGTRVVHRWMHDGKVAAEMPFEVGGARWRVESSKQIGPGQTGDWTVLVVDQSGRTLSEQTLRYLETPVERLGR